MGYVHSRPVRKTTGICKRLPEIISKKQNIDIAKYGKCDLSYGRISNAKISTTQNIDGQKFKCKISKWHSIKGKLSKG